MNSHLNLSVNMFSRFHLSPFTLFARGKEGGAKPHKSILQIMVVVFRATLLPTLHSLYQIVCRKIKGNPTFNFPCSHAPSPYLELDERRRVTAARDDLRPVPQGEGEVAAVGLELVPREGRGQLPKVFPFRIFKLYTKREIHYIRPEVLQ